MLCTWLHTADLHLGQPIKDLRILDASLLQQRIADYIATFDRIIELARVKKPLFLFISGDFLEHGYVDATMFDRIEQAFKSIPATKIFISPGNHDPYRYDSCYALNSWPDNLYIFSPKWEKHYFPELDLHICGKGFADFSERSTSLPEKIIEGRKILIVHGTLSKQRQSSDYFPIWEEELLPLELDYVAAGHIHKPETHWLCNERKTVFRYAGSPEALNWKELGPRTVTWGRLNTEGSLHIEEIPVHSRLYQEVNLDISSAKQWDDIVELAVLTLAEKDRENCLRIRLQGRLNFEISRQEAQKRLLELLSQRKYKYIALENELQASLDIDYLRGRAGIAGLFIKKIEDEIERELNKHESDKRKVFALQKALLLGLESLTADQ